MNDSPEKEIIRIKKPEEISTKSEALEQLGFWFGYLAQKGPHGDLDQMRVIREDLEAERITPQEAVRRAMRIEETTQDSKYK